MIEKLYEEAERKASNNKDRQAYISPSKFGFKSTSEGTRACKKILDSDPRFKKVKISARDLLDILLY